MAAKRKKPDVPRQLECSGELCLAFANTATLRRDHRCGDDRPRPWVALDSYSDLVTWVQRMGALTDPEAVRLRTAAVERPDYAAAALARGLGLRAAIRRFFTGVAFGRPPEEADLAVVNGVLRETLSAHQVVPGGDDGFRWGWCGDGDSFAVPLGPLAFSAAELLISGDGEWIRQCDDRQCTRLFVDCRSRRRRWCEMNICGNRDKGGRHNRRMSRAVKAARRRRLRTGDD